MTDDPSPRIVDLQKQLRSLRRANLLLFVLVLGLWCTGWSGISASQDADRRPLRTSRLDVVDENGARSASAILSVGHKGPQMLLLDDGLMSSFTARQVVLGREVEDEHVVLPLVEIREGAEGGEILVYDREGAQRVFLGCEKGGGVIRLWDERGRARTLRSE